MLRARDPSSRYSFPGTARKRRFHRREVGEAQAPMNGGVLRLGLHGPAPWEGIGAGPRSRVPSPGGAPWKLPRTSPSTSSSSSKGVGSLADRQPVDRVALIIPPGILSFRRSESTLPFVEKGRRRPIGSPSSPNTPESRGRPPDRPIPFRAPSGPAVGMVRCLDESGLFRSVEKTVIRSGRGTEASRAGTSVQQPSRKEDPRAIIPGVLLEKGDWSRPVGPSTIERGSRGYLSIVQGRNQCQEIGSPPE